MYFHTFEFPSYCILSLTFLNVTKNRIRMSIELNPSPYNSGGSEIFSNSEVPSSSQYQVMLLFIEHSHSFNKYSECY